MKKWQFDVWSHAVTIANKMESGGKPGKINITETTHSHLGGKFNLEPAYGEKCDEMLQTGYDDNTQFGHHKTGHHKRYCMIL